MTADAMALRQPGRSSGRSWLLRLRAFLLAPARRRAAVSLLVVLALWQAGATSGQWLGHRLPGIGSIPSPVATLEAWHHLLSDPGYWQSWYLSFVRVAAGFAAATVAGVLLGLGLAVNPVFRGVVFPVFELLRPIPPLAWVPASIVFWPTQELSIDFVVFLGAFYTIALSVVGGAEAIDVRLIQAAQAMGGSRFNIFGRLILPAVLPSICTGMQVGIGITWEVVVAAEMISGGGSGGSAATGGGLGFFIWNSYVGGSTPQILVGMISIGLAGTLSSAAVRRLEGLLAPWRGAR